MSLVLPSMSLPANNPSQPVPHWAQGLPLHLQQAVGYAVVARMHHQTDAVQALLRQRWGDTPQTEPTPPPVAAAFKPVVVVPAAASPSPLAQLVQHLQPGGSALAVGNRVQHGLVSDAETKAPAPNRLRSAQRFGQLARQVAVEQQVAKALRAPADHAGPLNPSRLVQRVLQHMQDLSPEYLHQFMEQMDTLLWLDENPVARVVKKKSNQRTSNKR